MSPVKILLAEGMEDVMDTLRLALQEKYHVQACHNGSEAFRLLHSFQPDILVVDLELPEIDGFTLLQDAAAAGIHPMVLVLTRLNNDYVSDMATQLGIKYIIVKPFTIRAVTQNIDNLIAWMNRSLNESLSSIIIQLLEMFEIDEKRDGYDYLKDAVTQTVNSSKCYITKEIYPEIAKKYDRSTDCVEHSIRTAIRQAWKNGDPSPWHLHFPKAVSTPPSNKSFVDHLGKLAKAILQKQTGGRHFSK